MKQFAIFADTHLSAYMDSVQYDVFNWAVEDMKSMELDGIIAAGDLTALGECESMDYLKSKLDEINAEKVILLGNSELRTPENIPYITSFACGDGFAAEGISIIAINTPDGKITPADRQRITASPKNSVIVLHHYLSSLEKDSDDFIKSWAEQSEGLILQAHSHRPFDYYIGSTRVVGLNTMDPEKAIETPPGYNILRIDGDKYELSDRFMPLKPNNLEDFRDLLGVSCANNEECLDYAIEHKIKCIEIRKPEFEEERIEYILQKVAKWRAVGGKILSIHMTDIKYDGSEFTGVESWNKCIDLAKRLNVDTMTVHVPRVKVKYMEKGGKIWNKYLEFILPGLHSMPETTAIAIENLHMNPGEPSDENRGFGYIPEEVMDWVAAVNADFGYERAGHLFDIGHGRNNAPFRSKYTLGAWYSIIGRRINAYHMHQVRNTGTPSHNHKSIINWYGGLINFFAFWLAWQKNQINHKPMFLELKSVQCYEESYSALDKIETFRK